MKYISTHFSKPPKIRHFFAITECTQKWTKLIDMSEKVEDEEVEVLEIKH